jgi:hypothetical protein
MNKGLYVSYNEERNGTFDEAVRISNKLGCVTWLDNFPLNPEQLHYPTDLFVKVTGQERYFRGILLAIASANTLEPDFVDGERNHRPSAWREGNKDFRSVLFISGLREVAKPPEIEDKAPPQHPTYVDIKA